MSGIEGLLGLHWADRGRSVDGSDCWGFLSIAFARLYEIELPAYDGRPKLRCHLAPVIAEEKASWRRLDAGSERPGDVVLFHGMPPHVGLVIGAGRMLHMPRGGPSEIASWRSALWSPMLDGFYRHPLMAGGCT